MSLLLRFLPRGKLEESSLIRGVNPPWCQFLLFERRLLWRRTGIVVVSAAGLFSCAALFFQIRGRVLPELQLFRARGFI